MTDTIDRSINSKPVFALGQLTDGTGAALMIGFPEAAIENMKKGIAPDLDLSKLGVPLKIMFFSGADHDACMKVLEQAAAAKGVPLLDERRKYFSINGEKK